MRKGTIGLLVVLAAAACGGDRADPGTGGRGGAGTGGIGAAGIGGGAGAGGGAGSGGQGGRGGAGGISGAGGLGGGTAGSGGGTAGSGGGTAGSGGAAGGGGMSQNDCTLGGGECMPDAPGSCADGTIVRLSCGVGSGDLCCVRDGSDACTRGGGECVPVVPGACEGGTPSELSCGGGVGVSCCIREGGGTGATCGGFAGLRCAATHFCDYLGDQCGATDMTGTCQPRPQGCADIYMPVCGCDGRVHGNSCEAQASGADVNALGGCTPPAGQFPCGAGFCAQGMAWCSLLVGGPAPGVRNHECRPLPSGCGADPACSCLDATAGCQCEESAAGDLTVTCFAP